MKSNNEGKLPPQAIELEEYIIGAILLEQHILDEVLDIIDKPEVFYKHQHQILYDTLMTMRKQGSSIDIATVIEYLTKTGELENIGGAYGLTKMTMGVVSSAHTVAHCRVVQEKYILRELIKLSSEIINKSYANEDVFDVLDFVDKKMFEISLVKSEKEPEKFYDGALEVVKEIQHQRQYNIKNNGVHTGFPSIDRITGGWQNTDLIILAARPSQGKSALMLNFAINAAMEGESKHPVLIFSLEMSNRQLLQRMISNITDTPLEHIKTPLKIAENAAENLSLFLDKAINTPIYLDDTAALKVSQIKSKCRKIKKKKGLGLIIIDYLQLIQVQRTNDRQNRNNQIEQISRELKILAKELDVPVICLSQLNRQVENRSSGKPNLSDLRDSGAIEQDADIVAFLYEPTDEMKKSAPELEMAKILEIAKHRNGELDSIPLFKDMAVQKFSETPFGGNSQWITAKNNFNQNMGISPIDNSGDMPF